ncbi:hypothetical protein [Rhodoferax aquaticus]|uniref:STAS/SEC14 domain-containing protein n=1 Tax=Rhodoferax aquaticus TaxID=2527691 RepID=A0A515ES49_9BURK|nr:hypothetical protein [Rhodoferax aquaticus]QDL55485.1 hypothetical protein EXZ61_15620 [Rhodoferax aquaticus]
MPSSPFNIHGKYTVETMGPVLVCNVTGPWNIEMVQEWVAAMLPFSQQLSQYPKVGAIVTYHQSILTTPEAMALMQQVMANAAANKNYGAYALVADAHVEGRSLVEPIFTRIFEGHCAYRFFYTFDEAKTWIESEIKHP